MRSASSPPAGDVTALDAPAHLGHPIWRDNVLHHQESIRAELGDLSVS